MWWDLRRCAILFGSRGSRSLVLYSRPAQEAEKNQRPEAKLEKVGFGSLPIFGHQNYQWPGRAERRKVIGVAASLLGKWMRSRRWNPNSLLSDENEKESEIVLEFVRAWRVFGDLPGS